MGADLIVRAWLCDSYVNALEKIDRLVHDVGEWEEGSHKLWSV